MSKLETENQAPPFEVTLAGTTFKQDDPKGLQSIMVEDHVDMIGVAEIAISGNEEFEWSSLEMGADVKVVLGGSEASIFEGYITGLRHSFSRAGDVITVLAMDPLMKLAASRVVKVYEEMTDSDIAQSLIGDAGLSSGTVDSTSGTNSYVFQRNESNLSLMRRLAARNGYIVMSQEGKVDFKSAQFSGTAVEIAKDALVSLDYSFSTRHLPPNLTVYGWDYLNKQKVEGSASSSDIQTVGGGTNALSDLGDLWSGDSFISDVLVTSDSGASTLAAGELNRLARNFLRGKATILGNASLRAGVNVKFTEHAQGFCPEGFVVSSRHRVSPASGFMTEVMFCSNTYPA